MKKVTKAQSQDTGMAMVLLMLIIHFATKREGFVYGALALQVVTMTAPRVFGPVAVVWLGLAHVIGLVMSKVLLSIVFFLVVTPIAILRNLMGKDSLRLRGFKASNESVMMRRNHTFSGKDLEKPY